MSDADDDGAADDGVLSDAEEAAIRSIVNEETQPSATRRQALKVGGLAAGLGMMTGGAAGATTGGDGDEGATLDVASVTANTYQIADDLYGGVESARTELNSELGSADTGAKYRSDDTGAWYHWNGSSWGLMDGKFSAVTADSAVIANELGLPEYDDVANAPQTQGRLVYATGNGTSTEGIYKHDGSSYAQVGGGSSEWQEDGSGNIVPIDGETVGDGTTSANHQSVDTVYINLNDEVISTFQMGEFGNPLAPINAKASSGYGAVLQTQCNDNNGNNAERKSKFWFYDDDGDHRLVEWDIETNPPELPDADVVQSNYITDTAIVDGQASGTLTKLWDIYGGENMSGHRMILRNMNFLEVNGDIISNDKPVPRVPYSTTGNTPAFGSWTQVSADRPSKIRWSVSTETDGSSAAFVNLQIDESGGTNEDYSMSLCYADPGLGSGGTDFDVGEFELPPGAQYRFENGSDPANGNSLGLVREMIL